MFVSALLRRAWDTLSACARCSTKFDVTRRAHSTSQLRARATTGPQRPRRRHDSECARPRTSPRSPAARATTFTDPTRTLRPGAPGMRVVLLARRLTTRCGHGRPQHASRRGERSCGPAHASAARAGCKRHHCTSDVGPPVPAQSLAGDGAVAARHRVACHFVNVVRWTTKRLDAAIGSHGAIQWRQWRRERLWHQQQRVHHRWQQREAPYRPRRRSAWP